MNLNTLLTEKNVDPRDVLVMRHRPYEPELKKVLPWLAAEKPDVFNAYQQTQGEKVENAMLAAKHVASFIGHEPGKALFVGLYSIGKSTPLTYSQFWSVPAYIEMKTFGMRGFTCESRDSVLWFELDLLDFYSPWKGKLVVDWPPPERSWWRRAHRNEILIHAVLEDSLLDAVMPQWDAINLNWDELGILPARWRLTLSQWRGIYYIYNCFDRKGYVGSASGAENIFGRWQNYAATGHGGNRLLRERNPKNFQFSILQRVSPDMEPSDIVKLENGWKERLHTRAPLGLNDN